MLGNISIRVNLPMWGKVFRLLGKSSKRLSALAAVSTVVEAILALGALYLIKLLIDTLTAWSLTGDLMNLPSNMPLQLGTVGLVLLLAAMAQSLSGFVRTAQGIQVSEYVDREIHDRAVSVDLGFYESPAYFDSLQRARATGTQRPAQVVSSVLLLGKSLVFLGGVLVLLTGIDWRILPGLVLTVAAILAVRVRFTRALYLWQRERVQIERRAAYLDWLITSDHHAKELRIGGLGYHLREAYGRLRSEINARTLKIESRRALAEVLVTSLGVLVFAGAAVFLVFEALAGQKTVGDLVLFVLLFRRAEMSGRELVQHVAKLYDDQLYLKQLFDFLSVESRIKPPAAPHRLPEPLTMGLRIEGMDFHYPGARKPALTGIDMTLEPGKVVALVGANGSGKTSLIKLLTRLYDPVEGRITLDGIDIRSFDPQAYRGLFSVIFQDYAKYAATVRDNIRYGDIERSVDDPGIRQAASRANATRLIDGLSDGYDTPLSRMFDGGQEISIGEWQKIALARAFFPNSRFLILDEPTSALDPQAEFELFESFRSRIGTRAALIISHRLSTVQAADYTYVMDSGRIVEHGKHDALVAQNGRYAELFEMQGRAYREAHAGEVR